MQTATLDVNEVVTNLAKMLQRILGEDIQLRLDLHGKPLWILADAGMIDQVLMNLSVNSRDAMPEGGRLTVATGEQLVTAEVAARFPHAQAGRYCFLSITDSGSGIAPDILPKIFEPFFTTKEIGKGTGLGLATVYGIVDQHKGWVDVATDVGHGTTFRVFLPMMASEDGTAGQAKARPRPMGGSEVILLVEDDVEVRKVTRMILERYGYQVVEAGHGRDAMAMVERMGGRIDLLLTDMVLPEGMHGRQVANAIRALIPRLKVIFVSGYSPELAGRPLVLQTGESFVSKPFESEALLTTVRECLDADRAV